MKAKLRKLKIIICISVLAIFTTYPAKADQRSEDVSFYRRFPMCEKFLPVEWISPERAIGTTRYILIDQDGSQRTVDAIVYLDKGYPRLDYGAAPSPSELLTEWERSTSNITILTGRPERTLLSEQQKEAIRSWSFEPFLRRDGSMQFKNGNDIFLIPKNFWSSSESLEGHKKNICLLHPKNRRAWLIETPRVESIYMESEIENRYKEISPILPKEQPSYFISAFKKSSVIDVNGDGMKDYPGIGVYSFSGKYYRLFPITTQEDFSHLGLYRFEANDALCEQYPPDSFFLETDGESYLLNGKCNLSRLTTAGKTKARKDAGRQTEGIGTAIAAAEF